MSWAMPLAICPRGAQPLLLHDGVLTLPQVVIRLLQGAVQAGLMACQCDVLAELLQELALPAAEGLGIAARAHQHSEHLISPRSAVQSPPNADRRAASLCGKRERHLHDIGFVDQLAGNAGDNPFWSMGTFSCSAKAIWSANTRPETPSALTVRDCAAASCRRKTTENPWADSVRGCRARPGRCWQVLALARCAGDVLQQTQPAELGMQFAFRLLNFGEHLVERVGEQVELVGAGARGANGVVGGAPIPPGWCPPAREWGAAAVCCSRREIR